MADRDLRDQIASIESDIEQLAQALEGCRKAMALSKMAIAAGGIWILVYLLGAIRFEPATMIGAIASAKVLMRSFSEGRHYFPDGAICEM